MIDITKVELSSDTIRKCNALTYTQSNKKVIYRVFETGDESIEIIRNDIVILYKPINKSHHSSLRGQGVSKSYRAILLELKDLYHNVSPIVDLVI